MRTLYDDAEPMEPRAIDVSDPRGSVSRVALYYVHGGGWYAGSRTWFAAHLDHFASRGHVCASAGYRTDLSSGLVDKLNDVVAGYRRFTTLLRAEYPSVAGVVAVGSSAGAHLVSLLSLRGADGWDPVANVLINPPGRLTPSPQIGESVRSDLERLAGAHWDRGGVEFADISPDAKIRRSPGDFLFVLAGDDDVFPAADVERLASLIQGVGGSAELVTIRHARHGFFYKLTSSSQRAALAAVEEFVERYEFGARARH